MSPNEWTPKAHLQRLDHEFEDVIDHFMRHDWGEGKPNDSARHLPPVESFVDSGCLVVRLDLPGVGPSDVEIKVEGNCLTITGSRSCDVKNQDRDFVHREINYGTFARTISIPAGVKAPELSTEWCDGVLEIILPLSDDAASIRIPIEMGWRAKESGK